MLFLKISHYHNFPKTFLRTIAMIYIMRRSRPRFLKSRVERHVFVLSSCDDNLIKKKKLSWQIIFCIKYMHALLEKNQNLFLLRATQSREIRMLPPWNAKRLRRITRLVTSLLFMRFSKQSGNSLFMQQLNCACMHHRAISAGIITHLIALHYLTHQWKCLRKLVQP